jgi:hypothetical protein
MSMQIPGLSQGPSGDGIVGAATGHDINKRMLENGIKVSHDARVNVKEGGDMFQQAFGKTLAAAGDDFGKLMAVTGMVKSYTSDSTGYMAGAWGGGQTYRNDSSNPGAGMPGMGMYGAGMSGMYGAAAAAPPPAAQVFGSTSGVQPVGGGAVQQQANGGQQQSFYPQAYASPFTTVK